MKRFLFFQTVICVAVTGCTHSHIVFIVDALTDKHASTAVLEVQLDSITENISIPNIVLSKPLPQQNKSDSSVFSTQGKDKVLSLSTKHNLSCFRMAIKEHLFPVYKFCTNLGDLQYSTDTDSVCQIILTHTDLNIDDYETCWNAISGYVKRDLSLKRYNVVGHLQRKFRGTPLCYSH